MGNFRDYQSFSSLDMLVKCELRYMFRYPMGIKSPPKGVHTRGKSGHLALKHNYSQKIDSHKNCPLDEVLDVARDSFEAKKVEVEPKGWDGKRPEDVQKDLLTRVKSYHTKYAPTIQPIEAEKEFIIEVSGKRLKLYRDLKDVNSIIHETKFSDKAKSQGEADNDLQLTIYSYADRTPDVCFDVVKKEEVATKRSVRTPQHWQRLELLIPTLIKRIESGEFRPCDPTWWGCSEKWCGYWFMCPHGGGKPEPMIVDMGQNKDEVLL